MYTDIRIIARFLACQTVILLEIFFFIKIQMENKW